MILFNNSIIKLEYNPANDIGVMVYPNLFAYQLPEIQNSIDILIGTVRNYDIKKLLFDSSSSKLTVGDKESEAIITYLVKGLQNTRVQKVARLANPNISIENHAQTKLNGLQAVGLIHFELKNFTDKEQALDWLMNKLK
ncbi:hypothetical protein [Adhaeribacter aquaticus]|uniref:hypothetical protein n=1 Tax=Adhaeribacter aquaticus TaxID=299567 RepID=UPI00047ADBBB|nr:hypothetical protein [Adhaeribacter aquaticus]